MRAALRSGTVVLRKQRAGSRVCTALSLSMRRCSAETRALSSPEFCEHTQYGGRERGRCAVAAVRGSDRMFSHARRWAVQNFAGKVNMSRRRPERSLNGQP